ncbi:uncharacterized protein LOC108672696 [Hyalella azteca]|uniref:Uncharacterized protein LOC108672696 n=1 Tax=Hyalella azteca TaxID=294128 RepID=A0A8B7NQA5_HYAAZ|nr:uncharacterized protein LOC108672696 [Hyalella azteca]
MSVVWKLMTVVVIAMSGVGASNTTCRTPPSAPNYVNALYEGHWFEMGRSQTPGGAAFQVGCMCDVSDFVTDEPVQGNGTISYVCRRFSPLADPVIANATLVDTGNPGEFKQVYPYPNSIPLNYYVIYIDEVWTPPW